MKDFKKAFNKLLTKVQNNEQFAFARFSDGELYMMRNQPVIIGTDHYVTGDIKGRNVYGEEEVKEFLPERDQVYRDKLLECFKDVQPNYFKGICTSNENSVTPNNPFNYQIDLHGGDHETLTYANLLINSNYPRFMEEMMPVIAEKDVIYVVNKLANTDKLPFKLKKKFEIGANCMINDFHLIEEIKEYIAQNNIKEHVILCSAATLSNFIIHDCFVENNQNTFLDIGSCLNPLLELEGWKGTRGYLQHYWLNINNPFAHQIDYWR